MNINQIYYARVKIFIKKNVTTSIFHKDSDQFVTHRLAIYFCKTLWILACIMFSNSNILDIRKTAFIVLYFYDFMRWILRDSRGKMVLYL